MRFAAKDLVAFVRRDWALIADGKQTAWRQRRAQQTPAERMAAADELRRYAHQVRGHGPTAAEGAADLAAHRKLIDIFRRVPKPRR